MSLIINSEDEAPIFSLKEKLAEVAPLSKKFLFEKRLSIFKKVAPQDLYDNLNQKVIGQENAKRRISLTVYEHLRNMYDYHSTEKFNVLLLGPSGSGKTLIANSISKKLEVPYVPTDATSFSPTGFQGADSENCIQELYLKAEGDVDIAQRGVVFIDEIDKLASNNTGTRLESFNYSTQSTLLKLIEGKKVKLPSSIAGEGGVYHVDTSKILFIFGGAFNGLEHIIGKIKALVAIPLVLEDLMIVNMM
jgi:ATP-dependent Clp protease ATP-binding subunit ClpX